MESGIVFNTDALKNSIIPNTEYIIGIDSSNDGVFVYSLCKISGDNTEVLLCKGFTNEDQFNEEIENLSKYFNAGILRG